MTHPRGKYKAPARRTDETSLLMGLPVDSDKNVNDLLHKLRGEQFRHQLNRRHTTSSPRAIVNRAIPPSLPYAHIFGPEDEPAPALSAYGQPRAAGPVPRSWLPVAPSSGADPSSPAWRATALALFLAPATPLPSAVEPLALLCVRRALAYYGTDADALAALRPHLPPHARRLLLRETAVHGPLERTALAALLGPAGHAAGETIVVGAAQAEVLRLAGTRGGGGGVSREEWDAGERDTDTDLDEEDDMGTSRVALLSAPLPGLGVLPPALTRLALVRLTVPAPVHRLPERCPLLEVLDLSYNDWLAAPAFGEETVLVRVRWTRWTRLGVLGLRGTRLNADSPVLAGVNEGRWVDGQVVEIVV